MKSKRSHLCATCEPPTPPALASVSGSDARPKTKRHIALVFAQKWLWESQERQTVNREWDSQYINDAVSMMLAYHEAQQNKDSATAVR